MKNTARTTAVLFSLVLLLIVAGQAKAEDCPNNILIESGACMQPVGEPIGCYIYKTIQGYVIIKSSKKTANSFSLDIQGPNGETCVLTKSISLGTDWRMGSILILIRRDGRELRVNFSVPQQLLPLEYLSK